jgi:type IV secretion system protein VirD4
VSALSGAGTLIGLAAFALTGLAARDDRPPSRARRPTGGRHPNPPPRRLAAGRPSRGSGARSTARWARSGELGPLVCHRPPATGPGTRGRLVLGYRGRRLLAAEANQSVIVFGPSQSRKTSGFAVPAILDWEGPVVATSVKADLVGDTLAYRRRRGTVACFDPTGSTGLPSATWSPLATSTTWPGARRTAASLTEGGRASSGSMADADFWYATATKMLAPLLLAAATGGRSMADVVRWVDTGEESEVLDLLDRARVPAAVDAARAVFGREERQRSSTATTVETILEPFADLAVDGPGEPSGPAATVDPAALVGGVNTLYLCAPAHDQRRLRPLFTAVLRQVVEHVYDAVTRAGRPLDPPLLVVLDEAANIAPLGDLDALASTAAGHGIQLVSVWHDLAQITARYGPRAPTVVNNHRAKVFLAGIADPTTLDHASQLIGDEELLLPAFTSGGSGGASTTRSTSTRRLAPPDALRRIPTGEGVLVYGGLPPARLRLRTWFDDPRLAARARGGEAG